MQRNQLAPMDVDRQAQPRPRRRGAAADPSPLPTQLENFARCMRSHGVPKWPDPTTGEGGGPSFIVSTTKDGFDPYSPQIQTKDKEGTRVEHPNTGEPLMVTP
jgi:hypothetical protein